MPEPIGANSHSNLIATESLMSLAPEEPSLCVAPPATPAAQPPAPAPAPAPSSSSQLVVEYDKRGPACERELKDMIRDCSYAALTVATAVIASDDGIPSISSLPAVARDVLRCLDTKLRYDDCQEEAVVRQGAEQRCEDRGGQVIRGQEQILCFEPR